jgi:sulfur-oxidizing protein SoxX
VIGFFSEMKLKPNRFLVVFLWLVLVCESPLVWAESLKGPEKVELLKYVVIEDSVKVALGGLIGDHKRGEQIVQTSEGQCTLCHSIPGFTGQVGNLGPKLHGVGSRYSVSQIRLRIINESLVNPQTIMPAFYKADGLVGVDPVWQGKPILNAQQIEDVVAYLSNLK